MKLFMFLLMILILAAPVAAQDNTPIEVVADEALAWDRINKTVTAKGNAKITQGESEITAPIITAYYDEADNIIIRKITARNNAVLKQPDATLSAQTVTADFQDGELHIITAENDIVLKTDRETLTGDNADYNALTRIITVTGDVKIEQGQNSLSGNRAVYDMNTNISTMTGSPQTGGRVKAIFYSEGE